MKKHNFYAGPAILPREVLKKAGEAINEFDGMGLSLIEISHRSKQFVAAMDRACALVKEMYSLSDEHEVIFLQGGASTQFYMTPFNLLNRNESCAYLDTGSWASKAIKEAQIFGNVHVVGSSKNQNYNYIPKGYDIPSDSKYFHFTSNNTIYGTQIHKFPKAPGWLVADMSSDIFCKSIDANQFDLIYAGAQKNLGPAGTTLVIVKKKILGNVDHQIPTMIDYRTHINKESMFNTPPVFAVYVCLLTLEWIIEQGGLSVIEQRNLNKSNKLYNEIDRNALFNGTAAIEDRSIMNVTFVSEKPELEAEFMSLAAEAGIVGIKGHRSVGGFRASIYNAMPEEGVDCLIDIMKEFEKKFG